MAEFAVSDGLYAIIKNMSASDEECANTAEKRISHIYDAADLARRSISERSGKNPALKTILTSDDIYGLFEQFSYKTSKLPFSESGSFALSVTERRLRNFDAMCFCRALCENEKYTAAELSRFVFRQMTDSMTKTSEKKIAMLRNMQSSHAFELFAANIRGVEAVYEDNFQSACESVYSRDCQYAIIPVESNADGRLDGLYRMMEKYGLSILMSCRVSQSDGNVTRFALVGRPPATFFGDDIKFEFTVALSSPSELEAISSAAEFFGAEFERVDHLPGIFGRDNSFGITLGVGNADFTGLLTYMTLCFSQFVAVGIYTLIAEE